MLRSNQRRTLLMIATIAVIFAMFLLSWGCNQLPSAEREQASATRQLQAEAQAEVGMPDIINWTERRQMKDILELRDQPKLATFTYIVNLEGELLPLCHSVGFGLPYSVQYTNPQTIHLLPQPDPNGLYMPNGLSATWVQCVDPTTGEVNPVYVEPAIIVSRFELDLTDWGNPGGGS